MHCMTQKSTFELERQLTARSTSSIVPPPVLTITGLPIAATYLSNGILVKSPEAIFIAGTSNSAKKSALEKSKAVAKK